MEKFDLNGKVCVVTGGAGLLGQKHCEAILESNGTAVLLDVDEKALEKAVTGLKSRGKVDSFKVDITKKEELEKVNEILLSRYGKIDVLINNAASNPKMANNEDLGRFENFSEKTWDNDLDVGLKGAFLCSQVFGGQMAKQKSGVILNISSDLGLIAPDQRIYKKENLPEEKQMVKPVTYSVAKHGIIGLTKYLATYWAEKNVRTNAVCFGGVYNNQEKEFTDKLTKLIPLGRMAEKNEYKSAVLFLISDASSYMTGAVLSIDGGRTSW